MSGLMHGFHSWVLSCGVLLILLAGCTAPPATGPALPRPVKTMVVSAGPESHVRSFPGKVDAAHRVELAFQISGLLVSLPVKEGQKVAKGAIIAELRKDEFAARLKGLQGKLDQARAMLQALRRGERSEQQLRLEAQLRAARARLANTRSDFDRLRGMPANAVARVDVDRAETNYKVAQEEYQSAQQLLDKGSIAREEDIWAQEGVVRGLEGQVVEANIQLDDATLRAPFDGVIARRFVEENQNIRAKEPVVRFQDVEEIDIAVDVPEAVMAADLRTADILQLVAEFSAIPGLQIPVQIREVAQVADPTTQTFQVRTALQAPPGVNLLPGMTANVTMTYRRASILGNPILVPIAAVYQDGGGEPVVWVVGPTQKVERRPVKLGAATGGQVEIVAGLQPGDRIAVAGVTFLRDGMTVRDLGDALGGGQP